MGDMADWTTDNGLMPEDEWIVSARDNEYEREIRTLRKENKRLREALEEIAEGAGLNRGPGESPLAESLLTHAANCIEAMKTVARAALRGEGEKPWCS